MKKLHLKRWIKETLITIAGGIAVALFLITLINCYLYAYERNGNYQDNYYSNINNR